MRGTIAEGYNSLVPRVHARAVVRVAGGSRVKRNGATASKSIDAIDTGATIMTRRTRTFIDIGLTQHTRIAGPTGTIKTVDPIDTRSAIKTRRAGAFVDIGLANDTRKTGCTAARYQSIRAARLTAGARVLTWQTATVIRGTAHPAKKARYTRAGILIDEIHTRPAILAGNRSAIVNQGLTARARIAGNALTLEISIVVTACSAEATILTRAA